MKVGSTDAHDLNPPRSSIKLERDASPFFIFFYLLTMCSNNSKVMKSKNLNRTRSQPPGEIFFGADRPGLPYHFQLKGVTKTLGFDVCVCVVVAHPASFLALTVIDGCKC